MKSFSDYVAILKAQTSGENPMHKHYSNYFYCAEENYFGYLAKEF